MRISGHCTRHTYSHLILWGSNEGHTSTGRKWASFFDNLLQDSGLVNVEELKTKGIIASGSLGLFPVSPLQGDFR